MSIQFLTGTVDRYIDGRYGYIKATTGEEYYFNNSGVKSEIPNKNDKVQFTLTDGVNGKPKAINVSIIKPESTSEYLINIVSELHNTDYDLFCLKVQEYAKELIEGKLSTSQIRKVYSLVTHAEKVQEVKRLRPQFAYAAGKSTAKGVKNLMIFLDDIVKNISTEQELDNLKTLLEAILAYLKFYGAKEIL